MGEVTIEVEAPGDGEAASLAIPYPEGSPGGAFSNGARELDGRLKGRLQRLADGGELKSDLGATVVLHTDGEVKARRIEIIGQGSPPIEAQAKAPATDEKTKAQASGG